MLHFDFLRYEFNPRIETQAWRRVALNWAIDGNVALALTQQPVAHGTVHFGGFLAPSSGHPPARVRGLTASDFGITRG
jgi:hypothetical protein